MKPFDPRITPARADLAAAHLRGQVDAPRFTEGRVQEVIDPVAPVRRAPVPDASLDTEALFGERVTIYETTEEGWAWGQLESDSYVGWLPWNALANPGPVPTHRVAVLRTFAFPGPSIKVPPIAGLPFGAHVAIAREDGDFVITTTNGFIPRRHVVPLDVYESDWIAVAERFIGTPYLWGGKSGLGLDCSALVQTALTACGIACPRDSDMQEAAVGTPVASGVDDLRRGDLVFWKGHVALARDAQTLVHANAFHMAVAIEPVTEALTRIRAAGSEVTSIKRISQDRDE